MISLQTSKQILSSSSEESLSKKRKLDDSSPDNEEKTEDSEIRSNKPVSESDFRSQPQFAPEWQRCLDIKSGQIYFYNTRTNKRVLGCSDSGSSPEQGNNNISIDNKPAAPMSLELKLNLPSQSLGGNCRRNQNSQLSDDKGLARAPSWLTFEDKEQEMVTAVCRKCYMLVMMSKTSPLCPNCKFVHPAEGEVTTSTI